MAQSAPGSNWRPALPEFSLVAGGPLFQFLCRAGLCHDNLMTVGRGIVIVPLLAWLPLLALSAAGGRAFGGSVAVPFLFDAEVHIRFLAALPLLMIAETVAQRRLRALPEEFLERNLIPQEAMKRFEAACFSMIWLRNSPLPEILLIVLVYGVGILVVWPTYVALDSASWYAQPSGEGWKLSLAGIWYRYVSLPIFQFLLCRWYFRLFVWAYFLWRLSRINFCLISTHPDRSAGLGFLSHKVDAFVLLALAHGVLLMGHLATRVVVLKTPLTDFKTEIGLMVVFVLCMILGPMLIFSPQLLRARREGVRTYGALAERYVREFDLKWLRGGGPADERLLGSADIQSLADMGNSYKLVQGMRTMLITRETVLRLAVVTLIPIAPLLLTIIPVEELARKFIAILLK